MRLHRRPRGKTVLVCPQCRAAKLVPEAGFITGQRYRCLACDYVGSLVLEEDLPADPPLSDTKT